MSFGLSVQEKKLKIDLNIEASLDCRSEQLLFLMYKLPRCFLPNFKSTGLSEQNIDFQDGGHGGHLGFLIGTVFSYF